MIKATYRLCAVDGCSNRASIRGKLRFVTRDDRPLPANISAKAYVPFEVCRACQHRLGGELAVFYRTADLERQPR